MAERAPERIWLIQKNGHWYRPNRAGYAASILNAGLYTEAEAKAEAAIEPDRMQAVCLRDCPPFVYPGTVLEHMLATPAPDASPRADVREALAREIFAHNFGADPDGVRRHGYAAWDGGSGHPFFESGTTARHARLVADAILASGLVTDRHEEIERLRWTRAQMPAWNDLPEVARRAGVEAGDRWGDGQGALDVYNAIRDALTPETTR